MAGAADPKEETFVGKGGLKIFVRSWRPPSPPRAVVCICHGVNSHSGYYFWAADQLVASGYAVYALDLRGRGKSDGDRFYVADIADYTSDVGGLVRLAKSREPGLSVFLLGHSAGGVTSCVYALDSQAELAGFICESFAYQVYARAFALALLKGLARIAPRLPVLKLPKKDFSRDPKVVQEMESDPLTHNETQPAITVAALLHGTDRMTREFSRITVPVLIMHGTADKVTKPGGSQFFHDNAGAKDKTLKLYKDHVHDMLNDFGKEQVMADITAWIASASEPTGVEPLRIIPTLDALLAAHATLLGDDFLPYRNHTYRVGNLAIAAAGQGPESVEKIAITAAFHDIGVWTDNTFDYIEPSVRQAEAYLSRAGFGQWREEIADMIRQHHKVRRYSDDRFPLVEAFRQADWADVSFGLIAPARLRRLRRTLVRIWPDAGFHAKLVRLALRQTAKHPLNPLPMLRL